MLFPYGTPNDGDVATWKASPGRTEWAAPAGGVSQEDFDALLAQVEILQAQIVLLGGGGVPDPSLSPSYANTDGTGDRTASVTVSASTSLFGFPTFVSRLVDGAFFFDNYFNAVADASDHWIQFDFGTPVYITEFRWYQALSGSEANAVGNWKWQGSNDGGSHWSDITASFALDSNNNVTIGSQDGQIIDMSSNIFTWSSYRMRGVSGSWATSSYIFEVEFKIDR